MAAQETVNDILGKGFKYEQRIEVQTIQEIISGTIFAGVGGANWGPVNVPTFINKNFINFFGNPLTRDDEADFTGLAMQYHMNSSPYAWMTRIVDGSETIARRALTKAATIAKILSSVIVKNQSYVIDSSNNKLKIGVDNNVGSLTDYTITLTTTPACALIESASLNPDTVSILPADTAYNYVEGVDYINFIVDNQEYRYIVHAEDIDDLNEPDFMRLIVSDQHNTTADLAGKVPSDYGLSYWDDYVPSQLSAGYQECGLTGKSDGDATGLANETTYNLKITVDGGTQASKSITTAAGSGVTFTAMIALLNAQCTNVTFAISGGDLRCTSKTSGMSSSVALAPGLTDNLWAAITGFTAFETAVNGDDFVYAEKSAYALKNYIVIPTLVAGGMSGGDAITAADVIVTLTGNKIKLNSRDTGTDSKIIIYNFPKWFPLASDTSPLTSYSSDTSISSIVSEINGGLTNAVASVDNLTGFLTLQTSGAGAGYGIKVQTIASNMYDELGLTVAAAVYGAAAISDAGTFTAAYSGADGNTIIINNAEAADGKTLTIYIRDSVVASYFNYSLNVADANYIGALINNDTVAAEVVTFTTPTGTVTLPELPIGDMQLSGGLSGVANLTDAMYNGALEEYKNLDLYQIDVIGVPGSVSESIADMLQEVCEYRKDCFSIIDMPENVAGLPTLGGNIYSAINWHNGIGGLGRTSVLDSMYMSTYFPWIQINDGVQNDWYPPSVRVIGAVSQSDKLMGHKFAAPAGPGRTTITDIEALAIYLREDQKNRLYADELGNSINPIVFTKNRGFFLDGQKNTDRTFGAISRLNVLRTSLHIKKRLYNIAPDFFWAPLTKNVMEELAQVITNMMNELLALNAIKDDFTVTCDTSINTPIIEASRGLIAIVEWTPVRSIEKIKIISVIKDMRVQTVIGA